jgi:hypothetical protein
MKKIVKLLVLFTCGLLPVADANSQLKLRVINGAGADIIKVIEDYPNRFQNLMGDIVAVHAQSTDYACTLKITGAEECHITRFPGEEDISSWQAVMLTTENFEKAKQKYKSLYHQLNNTTVTIDGHSFKLKGEYNAPLEKMKFSSVLFTLEPERDKIRKLKTELMLEFNAPVEWKVRVLVYYRERENEESGVGKE